MKQMFDHAETDNRIEALGPDHIAGLADPAIYTDSFRENRALLYKGLPKNLQTEEIQTLGREIQSVTLLERPLTESPRRNSVQALRWIGSMSLLNVGRDADTFDSVKTVLRDEYGIRGKLDAISLWAEDKLR